MKPIVRRSVARMLVAVLGILAICIVVVAPSEGNTAHAAATHGTAATGLLDTSNCAQPPTNVDHATFTDAQLDLYGLPHRLLGESLEHWQWVVRAAKHRVCTGTATNIRHVSPAGRKVMGTAIYNEQLNIWAGNIAYGYGYTTAIQQWKQPCLTLLLHDGVALMWTGLGGDGYDGGGSLIQSGTAAQEYSDFPGHWTAQYYAWIEDVPWNPTVIRKFDVSCNDTMYASDYQVYSGGNPVEAHMYISDVTTGQYAHSINTNSFSNGSTAEWIVERASTDGGWSSNNLAKFNSVTYTHCEAVRNGSYYSPINLPHNYSTMYYNGHDLVSVGSLYADSSDSGAHFTMTWLRSS